jgi:hypothetical protein
LFILRAMPRPRKTDAQFKGIVETFARELSGALRSFIDSRVASARVATGKERRGRRRGARVLCYYTGCKNLAAPRYGMFCAAEHRNLSKADKAKYRALHDKRKAAARPIAAKRKARGKRA